MNQYITDTLSIGAGLLSGGAGLRFVVGAVKVFFKDVVPLMKQKETVHQRDNCMYHDSMSEVVKEFKKTSETLVRIETLLETNMKAQTENLESFKEVFSRLRDVEIDNAVLKGGK